MVKYKNTWYKKDEPTDKGGNPEFYEVDSKPFKYRGYLIYKREEWGCTIWDIVKDSVCVGQNAGSNGALNKIDELHGETPTRYTFRGFGKTINGLKTLKIYDHQTKKNFSIQTNGNLPTAHKYGCLGHKVFELEPEITAQIQREIKAYKEL